MGDRGASEVLSFALVFGIILTSVALLSVSGLQTLQDARDAEQLNNAERAFDVLSDNMADIHQRGAPSRATEISLRGVQLYTDDNVTINVTATSTSGDVTVSRAVRPIVYEAQDDTRLVYEGGAVFRVEREGGLVVEEPPLVVDTGTDVRVLFPVIATTSRDRTSVGGSTALIRADKRSTRISIVDPVSSPSTYDDVYVNVTSPRRQYWQESLEAAGFGSCTTGTDAAGDGYVTCNLGTAPDGLYVPVHGIGIDIER